MRNVLKGIKEVNPKSEGRRPKETRKPKAERAEINPGGNRLARLEDSWRSEVPWLVRYVGLVYDPFSSR